MSPQNTAPNPGQLRRRVQARGFVVTNDKGNEIRQSFLMDFDYCQIEDLSGRELQAARVVTSDARFRFTFRYRPMYRTDMQLLFGDRVFEILDVGHDEEYHMRTTILAKEVNPA